MPIPFLSAEHLSSKNIGETFEPQRQNNGVIVIPNLFEVVPLVPLAKDIIMLSVESFPLPADSSNIIEVPWNNEKRKFAGSTVVDDVDLTIRQSVDPSIAQILQGWRDKVYDAQSGAVGWAKNYKLQVYFFLYPPDGLPGFQTCYRCDGCFPSRFARGDIDHAADDVVRIILTLSIDKVMPVKVGYDTLGRAVGTQMLPREIPPVATPG